MGTTRMRHAVDRYILGHEQEVSAESFFSLSHIPGRKDRFFCPECGEPVFFRAKDNGVFCHYKRVDGVSPECDKRVDGRSGLSLYERTGLPMYIVHDAEERYCLGISFPPLGRKILEAATQQKTYVRIAASDRECQFGVSPVLFFADQSTLLPVNFLPPAGANYAIEIQNGECVAAINQKWANYADGFEVDGAIFHYDDGSGRKVHHGDSISPGKNYYLVTERLYTPLYPEICAERIGSIHLSDVELTVSRLTVNVSTNDAKRYSKIDNYLRSRFGVWLLETTPELTTLWPPTVLQQDAQIPVRMSVKKLYCSVSSGNDTPDVYFYPLYPRYSVSQLNVVEGSVVLPFHGSEIAVSVDRKYVGREIFYRKSLQYIHDFSYKVSLEDGSGESLDWETFTQNSLAAVRIIKANAKIDLTIGCRGNIYQHVAIRENITPMPSLEYPEEVYWGVRENNDYSIFFHCHVKETMPASQLDKDSVFAVLKKHRYGPLVPTPVWVAWLIRDCSKRGYIALVRFICGEIRNGKIRLGLLKVLFSMKTIMIGDDSK